MDAAIALQIRDEQHLQAPLLERLRASTAGLSSMLSSVRYATN